jgi:hypothetical protein
MSGVAFDVLVDNAAIFTHKRIDEATRDDWERVWAERASHELLSFTVTFFNLKTSILSGWSLSANDANEIVGSNGDVLSVPGAVINDGFTVTLRSVVNAQRRWRTWRELQASSVKFFERTDANEVQGPN